jgi:hypothetical protein
MRERLEFFSFRLFMSLLLLSIDEGEIRICIPLGQVSFTLEMVSVALEG